MIKLFILAWLFIHPSGEGQMLTQAFNTIEECQSAGAELGKQSDELRTAGLVKDYWGACVPTEVDAKGAI